MKIYILIEPEARNAMERWSLPEFMESVRTAQELDRFAAELEVQIGQSVSVIEGNLLQTPKDGFIFYHPFYDLTEELSSMSESERNSLTKRLMILELDRSNAFAFLNKFKLLGGVEVYDYFLWRTRNHNRGTRIYALSEVVNNLPLAGEFQEGDFSLVTAREPLSLPEFLVSYLHLIAEV